MNTSKFQIQPGLTCYGLSAKQELTRKVFQNHLFRSSPLTSQYYVNERFKDPLPNCYLFRLSKVNRVLAFT